MDEYIPQFYVDMINLISVGKLKECMKSLIVKVELILVIGFY